MKAILLLAAFIFQCELLSLPEPTISGSIMDQESKEILPFANVVLYQNGVQIKGTTSNLNGMYELKGVPAGKYELAFSFLGYSVKREKLELQKEDLSINASLVKGINLREVTIEYERECFSSCVTFCREGKRTREDIDMIRCGFDICSRIVKEEQPEEVRVKYAKSSHIQLYPNPSTGGNVTLSYKKQQVTSEDMVEILTMDMLGKIIFQRRLKLENGEIQIQLKELENITPGSYFITLIDGEEKLSRKVIVQ